MACRPPAPIRGGRSRRGVGAPAPKPLSRCRFAGSPAPLRSVPSRYARPLLLSSLRLRGERLWATPTHFCRLPPCVCRVGLGGHVQPSPGPVARRSNGGGFPPCTPLNPSLAQRLLSRQSRPLPAPAGRRLRRCWRFVRRSPGAPPGRATRSRWGRSALRSRPLLLASLRLRGERSRAIARHFFCG